MTVRAILRNGQIQPIEPLPSRWSEGQELLIEEPNTAPSQAELDEWARDLEEAVAKIPPEEHERFARALEEIERESKEAVRRQWGLP